MSENQHSAAPWRISGRTVVASMFAMGIAATSLLFLYWNLHLMPFMPLQEAIVAEFEGSAPRVDGGQRKMHKGTPSLLRVVLKVPFNPVSDDVETQARLEEYLTRIRELANQHTRAEEFEFLEVHFYHLEREQQLMERTERRRLNDGLPVDENGRPVDGTASSPEVSPSAPPAAASAAAAPSSQQ